MVSLLNYKGFKNNNFKCILFKDIESIPLKTQLLLFNELKKKEVNQMKFFLKKK